MKTLYLLRHAKSDWSDSSLDDKDRPLAERGRTAAPAIGRFMAENGLIPDKVLCSTSRRTRQTLELVVKALGRKLSTEFEDDIYLAGARELEGLIRAAGNDAASLMLVGHNPGFHILAHALVAEGPRVEAEALTEKFPTAALAVIEFDTDTWKEVGAGKGRLKLFVRPRDLD